MTAKTERPQRGPSVAPTFFNSCAIIVTYFPDAGFHERLQRVLAQFPFVIVVDNGSKGSSADMLNDIHTLLGLEIVINSSNLGIAAALNQGVRLASQKGYQWAVTLDQDTIIFPDLLEALIRTQAECSEVQLIVGSNYYDRHRNKDFLQCKQNLHNYIHRKTVITSGTLMPLKLVEDIGGFREDYFIDYVDNEFCLRARKNGCKVVSTCKPIMEHSLGEPINSIDWLARFRTFNHSPIRKYYIARNSVATILSYFVAEPIWSLREIRLLIKHIILILLFEQNKWGKLRAIMLGILHGLAGKMGPVDDSLVTSGCLNKFDEY